MTGPEQPRRRPRLVASDLDGTLLGPDHEVSPRSRAALAALAAAGVPFVAVTGRAPRSLGPLEGTAAGRVVVCANGAITWDRIAGRVLAQHRLDAGTAVEVVERLRRRLPGLTAAVERPDGTLAHEPGYRPSRPWPGSPRPLPEIVGGGVLKVVVHSAGGGPDALRVAVQELVGAQVTVTASASGPYVEIGPPGVDKASGLAVVAAGLGVVAADVVAFGDMPNDVSMLRWAGRGVAVANAHPDVLAVADEVAAHHGEDGVARWLEQLLGGGGLDTGW
jgi:hydroxymethylpyrimidine pyrophosphatase-like HAD family hydrolase